VEDAPALERKGDAVGESDAVAVLAAEEVLLVERVAEARERGHDERTDRERILEERVDVGAEAPASRQVEVFVDPEAVARDPRGGVEVEGALQDVEERLVEEVVAELGLVLGHRLPVVVEALAEQ